MALSKVAIIILNYNGFEDTKKCIKSILNTTYKNFEVFVIDNGSKENEAEQLKKIFAGKKLTFLRNEKNLGFTGGNNKILRKLKHEYVVLLNNDVVVTPHWLTPLVQTLEKNKNIAVVQPKILWLTDKRYFDYAGACGGFIDIFGYPFTRGRIFNSIEMDHGQYDTQRDIFWASGAAMIIRRKIFDKVGYFDERFFNYMEEIDLCYRILQQGYRIVCEPSSVVYHKVAGTASRNDLKKRFWEHRNNLLFVVKNFPPLHLISVFPLRILLEYVSVCYYIFTRRFDFAFAVILSQLSLLWMIPIILFPRIKISHKDIPNIKKIMYGGSVVFTHFILRKKRFSKIYYK